VSKARSYQSYQADSCMELNCLQVIVCVALRCPEELTKDLTFNAKDSIFVLEDISRPRTKVKDNSTDSLCCNLPKSWTLIISSAFQSTIKSLYLIVFVSYRLESLIYAP